MVNTHARGRGRDRRRVDAVVPRLRRPAAADVVGQHALGRRGLRRRPRQALPRATSRASLILITVLARELPRRRPARRLRPAGEALTWRRRDDRTRSSQPRRTRRRATRRAGAVGARPHRRVPDRRRARARGRRRDASTSRAQRDARHRRRVGLGQVGHVAGDPRAAARRPRRSPARSTSAARSCSACPRSSCEPIRGDEDRDDLPGRARRAEPGAHASATRSPRRSRSTTTCASTSCERRVDRAARPRRHPEPDASASTSTRTSTRAACASGR